jgi:ligand-binding sensor domain-containing protein/signal transduction histidine kinase
MYRFVLTNLMLLAIFFSCAQEINTLFPENRKKDLLSKKWTVDDGLASNSIGKIGKTKKGFLFICTYNGISLFDGKNFRNFTSANVPALKTNSITKFCIDKDSIFWIATYRGVIAYDGFDFYTPDALKSLESINIQSIAIDKKGTLWIGTVANGLFSYANGALKKVDEIKSIEKTTVSLLFSDRLGNTWIGTESGILYRYDGKKYVEIFHDRVENSILSAFQDKKGRYYFGTRNGLYKYSNNTLEIVSNNISFINDIKAYNSQNLWLSTNRGVFLYNPDIEKISPFHLNEQTTNQIIQNTFFDTEGNIWIGTYRKGIIQLRVGGFKNSPFAKAGISEVPSALAQISDSAIWIGTDEGNIYQLVNGKYNKVRLKTNLNKSRIKSIFIDSKKNTWVCSYNGLLKISNGNEKLLNTNSGFNDNTIRAIVENKDGSYWVATNQSGIYKITEDFKILKHLSTLQGLSSNFVLTIVKGKNGEVYATTKNGVDIIDNEEITKHINKKNGLIEDMVFNIYQDKENTLWLASIGGLSMIENGRITNFTKKNGLSDNKIFDVIEDDQGYLWLPIINGIIRVDKKELVKFSQKKTNQIFSIAFGKSDGMYDQQYVGASKALQLKNGNIALNTLSGISILNPKVVSSVKSQQKLIINNITTESNNFKNKNENIVLPPSNKYFQVNYSYIDFIHPDKVVFSYLLEPFDDKWHYVENDRHIKYTNIPPGEYTFTLKAIIKSQGGKELVKSINFTIEPAFYESTWFKFMAAIILFIFVWFIYMLRVKTIKHQKELLEKEVADRTAKISQQKTAIEKNLEKLEVQKEEIAEKNKEILVARNNIEQAYINLKLLSDLGKEITSSLSEKEIIKTVYQNINALMDADLVAIGIYNKKKDEIGFNSIIYKGQKLSPFTKQMDSNKCIICFSIANEMAIFSNNFYDDYPSFNQTFTEIKGTKPLTSLIILPFRSKKEVIGVLTAQSLRKNSYSDYHFNLMANLAVYVGIAIENTKTYKKIQNQKDELQQVNAAKDRMFSIIGHDLRSPVGTIKSFLDVIIENPEMTNNENSIKIFKTMQQSLGSAYALLDNLLLWARSQKNQLEFKPDRFNIIEPVKESISLVLESAKNKEIQIETEIDEDIEVFADKNMITTVLRNLISNAIKFTKKNGEIKVVACLKNQKKNNQLAEIKVIDNGVGITKENIDNILKVNEAFSTPGTDNEQGSGLGISICIDFLKKHKQKLHVENNMTTKNTSGTTFSFMLPVK